MEVPFVAVPSFSPRTKASPDIFGGEFPPFGRTARSTPSISVLPENPFPVAMCPEARVPASVAGRT